MKTILKITFFFFRSKPRFDLAHQIRLLYFLWIKQNKDSTLKEPSKKDNFPIDSIQIQGSIIGICHISIYTYF